MGDAAFKKAFKARAHRERAQPASRAKFGILEKHKDYIERAKNYHQKQDRLKALRIRASNRNPDEFHFGMVKSRFINGRHVQDWQDKTASLPADLLKLMKSQDNNYLAMQIRTNQIKLDKAKEELAYLGNREKAHCQHLIFARDDEEAQSLIGTTQGVADSKNIKEEDELSTLLNINPLEHQLKRMEKEVVARKHRIEQLEKLDQKLKRDRLMLQKGPRVKCGTTESGEPIFKWLPIRKR